MNVNVMCEGHYRSDSVRGRPLGLGANPKSEPRTTKTERRCIVEYRPQKGDTTTPVLNLSGKWLRVVGFDTGTGVTVRIAEGCIVLIPDSDEVRELRRQLQQTQLAVKRMAGEVLLG